MSRKIILSLVFILALTFMISCSGGDGNIITPEPVNRDNVAVESSGGTLCMGLWQVVIDAETGTGDIVQLRSADKILNVLGFMEPPALNMMDLDWPNLVIADPIVEVGVILTHPISNDPIFTGFDVRGVCFGPKVTNADGLTIITSPQYFKGVPFGYQDGLLGAPDSYGHFKGVAGYKYFCDGLGDTEDLAEFFSDPSNLDDRGSYGSGKTNQRDYILDWGDVSQNFLVFNYCVYANYEWPVGSEPYNIDDFEITTANCAEAFACSVTELANTLYYISDTARGGEISLQVEVWDWLGDISNVTIESYDSGIMAETGYDVDLGVFPSGFSYGYEFYAVPGTPEEVGDLDILITVTDIKTFGDCWFMDLLPTSNSRYNMKIYNCFIHTAVVTDCPPPGSVDAIDPDVGVDNDVMFAATVTGTDIMDGDDLGVALVKTGEPDIVGENVVYVDDTEVTCEITIPVGTTDGLYDVELTNGCGTPGYLIDGFEIFHQPTWNPTVTLSGSITKARATNLTSISDSRSTYRRVLTFNVSGSNATGGNGGPYTYEYYVSTSNTTPTGSPVGWVAFSFNNGGSFTVPWGDYASIAPDRVYLWVHADDGIMASDPVLCTTQIQLSRVCWQPSSSSYPFNGWGYSYYYCYWYNQSTYAYIYGYSGRTGWGRYYRSGVNFGSSANNQWEFFVSPSWYNYYYTTSNYLRIGHGTSSGLGYYVGYLYGNSTNYGQKSYNVTGYTGTRYIGFYATKNYAAGYFRWYLDDPAFYEDPT